MGIVYSETSADQFYEKFSYSQFFMAMQHQAMMAGIPFDVLAENDLTDSANLIGYDALIIAPMEYSANEAAIVNSLQTASNNGVGIISSGVLLTYEATAEILGIEYAGSGAYGVAATVTAGEVSHPVMRHFSPYEQIVSYDEIWFDSYQPVAGQTSVTLARINTNGDVHNGVLATIRGGRNVHFANDQVMGDSNLVWSALQWVVYDGKTPVGLKLGRHQSIFIGRNDMDSSKYADILDLTDIPLLDLLALWKQSYNFVGSYYINIGNNPQNGEYTDWEVSRPLYRDYIALGNEIGTHSYTHPNQTSFLSQSELDFEFNQSRLEIGEQLGIDLVGAAIPGNAESLQVDWQLNDYFQYVSGRSGIIGSGYPGAFGFLAPDYDMLYFSLNLSPDYTLIEYLGYTPADARQIWADEFNALISHTSQPIIHWLWHDYGPTIASNGLYDIDMYEDTIAMAFDAGTEFATVDDIQKRIKAFQSASLDVEEAGALTVTVSALDVGQFSLEITSSQVITSVDNWYAYDRQRVFIPRDGGHFVIHPGAMQSQLTRIAALPMRAKLISLSGDGTELAFTFEGEGTVVVELNPVTEADVNVQGADGTTLSGTTLEMHFDQFGEHSASISLSAGSNRAPIAYPQSLATQENVSLGITLTAGDPDGDPLSLQMTSSPANGVISGTPPALTYTPNTGFVGSDSFTFTASDGLLESSPATVGITVSGSNQPPVANSQSLTTAQSTPLAITLTATDPDGDPLTLTVSSDPVNGTLTGTIPNLTYTPATGFIGSDSFTFTANDGLLESSPATIAISVTGTGSGGGNISNYTTGITIDGNLADWAALVSFGPDPDDVTGADNLLDWREGWMAHDDNNFYLAMRNDSNIELSWAYNVYLDTDGNSASGFHDASEFPIGAEYLMQGGYLYQYTGDGSSWSWNFVATLSQAVSGTNAEFVIPRADIGDPTALRLFFYGDNSAYSASTSLDFYPDHALDPNDDQRFFTYAATASTNQPPVANSQSLTTPQGTPLAITLTATDPDGDPLTLTVSSNPVNGTLSGTIPNLTYTPDTGFVGSDSFTFTADDGLLESNPATVSITVSGSNQPPVANSQSLTTAQATPLAITLTATDPDGDPLTLTVSSDPVNGTLTGTIPNLTYTPDTGFVGSDSFTFTANDGLLESSPATIAISVTATGGGGGNISNYTTGITIDGNLADWAALVTFGPDPDDVTGADNLLDWREGWMAHDDNNFYLAMRNDSNIELSWAYNVYLDTDGNSASGFHDASEFPIGAEYLMQGGYLYQYTGDGSSWNWNFVAALSQAVSGTNAEFVIPRAEIGDPTDLRLFYYGDNNAYSDSASLDVYPDQALDTGSGDRFFEYHLD